MRRILTATLLSSFALTAAAATAQQANEASASAPALSDVRPISTGVTAPQLVYSTKIELPAEEIPDAFPNLSRVVLKVKLDQTGSPTAIQVMQPLTQSIDARVVEAVRQFRWRPAVLDNQAVPASVNLIVNVQR
ncbi:MAG: energy transducer TonB [Terracidiphilus sp.]